MFRKLVLALGATAVIGAAALAPTAASAWGWHHHHHHWGRGPERQFPRSGMARQAKAGWTACFIVVLPKNACPAANH